MSIQYRIMNTILSGSFALSISGCAANAPPTDDGSSGESTEVKQALAAPETAESMQTLQAMGWTRSEVQPSRVDRGSHGEWAVVIPMTQVGSRTSLDLVYVPESAANSKPMALVRPVDDETRASFASAPSVAFANLAAEVGCTPGCDSAPSTCVEWSCTYTSLVGVSFGCIGFGNGFGVFHVVTHRVGRTDPSSCSIPVLDVFAQPHSCPAPASTFNLLLCGWP